MSDLGHASVVCAAPGVVYGCAECARLRRAIAKALRVIAWSAGGMVAAVRAILSEALG